jgi:hypothetical protein
MDFLYYIYKTKINPFCSNPQNQIKYIKPTKPVIQIGNRIRSEAMCIPDFTIRKKSPNDCSLSKKIIINDIKFGRPLTKNLLTYIHKNFDEQEKLEIIIEYNMAMIDYNEIITEYQKFFRKI